ncbi:hypothetical protein [Streptomyces sp. NPDC098101]|uniref:hypothetical protein n=1 Tax=Streptomyces sp. NPDC098101 TaxID=3366096 RepID=UPI00382FE46D
MNEERLPTGKKWAARAVVLLAGAFVMVFAVLATVRGWEESGVALGLDGAPGRFTATACEVESGGRGGARTACTGTFSSDDGRTVAPTRLKWSGTDGMAVGGSAEVRCDADGTCLFAGATDTASAVATTAAMTAGTALVPLAAFLLARRIGRPATTGGTWSPE